MIRKLVFWAIAVFAVYYLVSDPHSAAHAVRAAFGELHTAGSSLSAFVSSL